MNTKQVIVVRHDLIKGEKAVRRGKMMAQVAHASLASLLKLFIKEKSENLYRYSVSFGDNTVLSDWFLGKFTKIVVYVPGKEELLELNKKLDESETLIPHALITDAGLTEFHGEPTVTCLGIGPFISEEIDKFTKDLPLL